MSPDSPSTSCAARNGRYATHTRRVAGEPGISPPYGSRPGEGPVYVWVTSRSRTGASLVGIADARDNLSLSERHPGLNERADGPRAALDVRGPERVESEREALDVELAPELRIP